MSRPGRLCPSLRGRALWIDDGQGRFRVCGWGSGGQLVVHEASEVEVAALSACDRSTELARVLQVWQERIPKSLRLLPIVEDERLAGVARQMLRELRAVENPPGESHTRAYHLHEITDAEHQFNRVEVTVSHAYGVAHPALGGRSYGQALFDLCKSAGVLRAGASIVEIGCGTGAVARAFLDRFAATDPRAYDSSRYTLLDLSPALGASQRELCAAHARCTSFVSADVEHCAIDGGAFDVVLCNEMIADLSVAVMDRANPWDGAGAQLVSKYGLDGSCALDRFLVNVGALRLVERIARWLRPGGIAWISEYGNLSTFPHAVELGGHVEHSIHFGHLLTAARSLGLEARCDPLGTRIGFDLEHEVLAGDSSFLLRRASTVLFGSPLEARAYDRAMLRAKLGDVLDRIGNLRWRPVGDRESFMSPSGFFALTLRAGGARRVAT